MEPRAAAQGQHLHMAADILDPRHFGRRPDVAAMVLLVEGLPPEVHGAMPGNDVEPAAERQAEAA